VAIVRKTVLLGGLALLVGLALALASCATAPAPSAGVAAVSSSEEAVPASKVYEGAGKDPSMLDARTYAIMDAVRKGVIELIGEARERANRDKLKSVLYDTANPNAFIDKASLQTLRKDKIGEDYIFEVRVAVNMRAVQSTLRANGLLAREGTEADRAAAKAGESMTAGSVGEAKVEAATPEEQRFIDRYVDNMTYMVYFNDQAGEDPFYMKAAVSIANEYLASNAMEAVDLEQVEKLKKDQQRVYEEQTGRSISMIQWIAQKLNADVYLEIDGRTTGESSGGKYYGQASITLKGFEASTGRLLGSQPWNSPRTFSTASQQAARVNALQTSVYKAMPVVLGQAKAYMAKAMASGIKYELVVQGSSKGKAMSDFRRKLKRKVKEVLTVSQAAEETRFAVFLIGTVEDLAEAVLDVAETIPGLEGMHQVVLRGKSVTFDAGN